MCCCFCPIIAQVNNDIKVDNINSKILNEERKIWVHVPEDNNCVDFHEKKYPVIYLLDANNHFKTVTRIITELGINEKIIPEMIIVGITNTNRWRDLTPTKAKPGQYFATSNIIANSGGGDNFISFIEKELIPYIDNNYPTDSYKMFIGHSLGGLTVMNTFIENSNLFNSYISIDPSMWWNDQRLLNKIKTTEFNKIYDKKSLFLAIASKGIDFNRISSDKRKSSKHIQSLIKLDSILKNRTNKELSFKVKYYKDENHGSVPTIAEYDGLKYIFNSYKSDKLLKE